jgi:hypothetical protein
MPACRDESESIARRRSCVVATCILAALACCLWARSSGAELRDFEAQLELGVPGLVPGTPTITASGVGVAEVNSGVALERLEILDDAIHGTTVIPVTDPLVSNGGIVKVIGNLGLGRGTFSINSSGYLASSANTLPVPGEIRLCLLDLNCGSSLPIPLTGGVTFNGVRGVGIGGYATFGQLGGIRISVAGAPWTIGTTTVDVRTEGGGIFPLPAYGTRYGPLGFTGTTLLTLGGEGGVLQAVTPITVSGVGGSFTQPVAGFATLRITFLPEPASLVPLGAGAACLLVLAGKRRHRRPRR